MGSALTIGLAMGGLSAATSLLGAEQERNQRMSQASALENQALATRRQAELAAQKGRLEAEDIDRRKSVLRREFESVQGRNRSLLAAGNVDMGSGSALDVSLGNIGNFAQDWSENQYQKQLKEWETRQNLKSLNHQAEVYDAQGSYLRSSAGNLGTSLLTAGISGLISGLGGYSMAGGRLPGLPELFGGGGRTSLSRVGDRARAGIWGKGGMGNWSTFRKLTS